MGEQMTDWRGEGEQVLPSRLFVIPAGKERPN